MYTVKKVTVTDSPTDSDKSGLSFSGPTLYAKLVIGEPSRKSVDFCTLLAPAGNGANEATSLESVRAIAIVLLILFMFSSKDGMDAMLENRPWFIRNNLFILKKWDPDVNLLKEDDGSKLVNPLI
ncbi:zinc finger, CCHC-type containing protein [Tanacetum coccineum]